MNLFTMLYLTSARSPAHRSQVGRLSQLGRASLRRRRFRSGPLARGASLRIVAPARSVWRSVRAGGSEVQMPSDGSEPEIRWDALLPSKDFHDVGHYSRGNET